LLKTFPMPTEANCPQSDLMYRAISFRRSSGDHLWPPLGDGRGPGTRSLRDGVEGDGRPKHDLLIAQQAEVIRLI